MVMHMQILPVLLSCAVLVVADVGLTDAACVADSDVAV